MPLVSTKDGDVRLIENAGKSIEKLLDSKDYVSFRISNLAPKFTDLDSLFQDIDLEQPVLLFVDFGPVDFNILGFGRETEYDIKTLTAKHFDDKTYSISRYPLSAELICVKLASHFEQGLEIF